MDKINCEYIWLDGNQPQQLRSKTKILSSNNISDISHFPIWSFDGSSTNQASGDFSDCLLKPIKYIKDPLRYCDNTSYLVLCEVLNADETPHITNTRAKIEDNTDFWFGFEQEYFFWNPKTNKPLGFPAEGYPAPQGQYYCSTGYGNAFGRDLAEDHLQNCLSVGLKIEGINAEVAPGQWEFQIFSDSGAKEAGDNLWLARYILERIAERNDTAINWHCKPLGKSDWNGSGLHTNFSNSLLRNTGGKDIFNKVCEAFRPVVKEHIDVYGLDNHLRLTGQHETASIDHFSYGVSDRGASIRIPIYTVKNGWKGYLEDRRPNSSADPYLVANQIIKTVSNIS